MAVLKVLQKDELGKLLETLSNEFRIIAPVVRKYGKKERVEYHQVEDFSEIHLNRQPDTPPKKYFLPQNERLGEERSGEEVTETGDRKTLIFGVRSCDLSAIDILKPVFLDDDFTDTYFQNRLENTLMFGLGCSERQENCFCDSLGINPLGDENVPVYMHDDGERIWFEVKAKELEKFFTEFPDGDPKELEEKKNSWLEEFKKSAIEIGVPIPLPELVSFNAPFWKEVAANCLGCGVCTYYCPTCFCFGFFWEKREEEIDKWRTWDSCMFPLFTKHGSGHNPRETQDQRTRQRIMHKFSYHPSNFEGVPACSACGRCISQCPVNIDLRVILKTAEKYLDNQEGVKSSG